MLAGLFCCISSQAIEPTEKGFTQIRGPVELTQNDVTSIVQDRFGFLWFGTQDGLIRYDGYEFLIYRHDRSDERSLTASFIRSLYKDSNGRLWIGTDLGINLYDETSDSFLRFPLQAGGATYTIEEDQDGGIWVGAANGLFTFNERNQRFTRWSELDDQHSNQPVWTLAHGGDGALWIGTSGGLSRLSKDGRLTPYLNSTSQDIEQSVKYHDVRTVGVDKNGLVWVGMFEGGLIKLDVPSGTAQWMNNVIHPDTRVSQVFEDSAGLIWIGTIAHGLVTYDPASGRVERLRHQPSDIRSISHDRIRSISEDDSGLVWIGTGPGGINRYDRRSEKLAHYRFRRDDPHSLSHNEVSTIHVDPTGKVWVGTFGGGLNQFDGIGAFQHFRHKPDDPHSLSSDRVFAVVVDSFGELWVGTGEKGLNRYDPTTKTFTRYLNDPRDDHSLAHNRVRVLFEDKNRRLWIGTAGGGLDLFDRENGRFIHYRHSSSDNASISENTVRFIMEDSNNDLWVGTATAGLNRLDYASGRFTRYTHNPGQSRSLTHNRVQAMFESPDHRLWVGTPAGLTEIDHEGRVIQTFSRQNGLANDIVYCIVGDNNGNLLLSTNLGISRFSLKSNRFENFDVSDGLQANEFFAGSCASGVDGMAMFGGVNGLTVFDPVELTKRAYQPTVVLTNLLIQNRVITANSADTDEPLTERLLLANSINLDYNENTVAFKFAALDFASPNRIRYGYRLSGYDPDWIEVKAQDRLARYSSLPAGDYEFSVRASNSSGIWGDGARHLAVSVSPPPWLSMWAIGGYSAAVLFLATLIIQINRRRTQYLENLVDKRTAELKEQTNVAQQAVQARSIFLAKMSHEIRTPLNAVMGMLQLLKSQTLSQEQQDYVQTSHESAAALLTIVDQILLFSRMEQSPTEIETLEYRPHRLINGVTHLMRAVAEEKRLGLESSIAENVPATLMGDPEKIRQICLNLISNAIRFTETGSVTVTVNYDADGSSSGHLTISVTDTGIGMTPDESRRVFEAFAQADATTSRKHDGTGLGLTIVKELVLAMGGVITVTSEPGCGSKFTVRLPLIPTESNNALQIVETIYPNIMLVEDVDVNRRVIEEKLNAMAHDVTSFADGHQAIESFARVSPDLVIMDINMPKLSGVDVASRLRSMALNPHCYPPIVALTAATTADMHEDYKVAGINGVLHKPFSYQRLASLLKRLHVSHLQPDWLSTHADQLGKQQAGNLLDEARNSMLLECEALNSPRAVTDELFLADTVHKIQGVADSFGFSLLSEAAAEVDTCLCQGVDRQARQHSIQLLLQVARMTSHCVTVALSTWQPYRPPFGSSIAGAESTALTTKED